MHIIALDTYQTLIIAAFTLLLGKQLSQSVAFLRKYTLPTPVIGGLVGAIFILLLRQLSNIEIAFDKTLQIPFLLLFFASVGLKVSIATVCSGGKILATFALAVTGLLFLQNALGITMAYFLGVDPFIGILGGSITLSGGHSTGLAWSTIFSEEHGFSDAPDIAMGFATLGLIAGGLTGGFATHYLVKKGGINWNKKQLTEQAAGIKSEADTTINDYLTSTRVIKIIGLLAFSVIIGSQLAQFLKGTMLSLPPFVCIMFVSIFLSNSFSWIGGYAYEKDNATTNCVGEIFLLFFLAIAILNVKLWELASLALPMLLIMIVQVILMFCYAVFVTYRMMGSNYDALLFTAGHCGFGLGATPTAIANMQALSDKYGPSKTAFLIIPIISAFIIDLINAVVIKLYLHLPFFY